MLSRRAFALGLLAAPAVVKYGSLMPVRGIIMPIEPVVMIRTSLPEPTWRMMHAGVPYKIWANAAAELVLEPIPLEDLYET